MKLKERAKRRWDEVEPKARFVSGPKWPLFHLWERLSALTIGGVGMWTTVSVRLKAHLQRVDVAAWKPITQHAAAKPTS
jgi:hypothetical protein